MSEPVVDPPHVCRPKFTKMELLAFWPKEWKDDATKANNSSHSILRVFSMCLLIKLKFICSYVRRWVTNVPFIFKKPLFSNFRQFFRILRQIGRASCRERV